MRTLAPRAVLALLMTLLLPAPSAQGRVYMTQRQALEQAFPQPAQVSRRTLYLDADQVHRVATEAGAPVENRVVAYYIGTRDGKPAGCAYFDTHLVRTLPETIMVVVAPDGRIERIDILSFEEPEDYLPNRRWLQQFPGRLLDDDLSLKQGIHPLAGATLSARAITQAVRRVLALHRLFVAPSSTGAGGAGREPGGAQR
ncbi:MAG TPA: FMN-binding protein [Candidatus Polarisedimenticolia bacterium]|nr:FMN-binding protein [Candidatus Polarisedimenticolia bacterium]